MCRVRDVLDGAVGDGECRRSVRVGRGRAGKIVEAPPDAVSDTLLPATAPPEAFRSCTVTVDVRPLPASTSVGDAAIVVVDALGTPPVGALNESFNPGCATTVIPSSVSSAATPTVSRFRREPGRWPFRLRLS